MNKWLLTLLLVFGFGYMARAQIYLMPKAGISLANITYRHSDFDSQSKPGIIAGIALDIESLRGSYSLQPELVYVSKGFRQQGSTTTYHYIDLPLMGKYTIGRRSRIQGYAVAGPFLGLGLSGVVKRGDEHKKIRFGNKPDNYEGDDLYLSNKTHNRIDAGFQFGAGLSMQTGNAKWILDARYSLGVANLHNSYTETYEFRGATISNVTIADGKFRSFYITAGVGFPIGY